MTYRNIGMLSHQEQEGSTNSNNMSNNSECKTRLLPYPHSNSHSKWRWTAGVQLHVSQPKIRWNLIARTASLQGFGRHFHSSCCAHEGMCEWSLCICIKTWIYHLTRQWKIRKICWECRFHQEWRLCSKPFGGSCAIRRKLFSPQTCSQQKLRFYSRSNLCPAVLCRLPIFQDLIPSKPPWLTYRVSLDFRKASALNALYLLEICKASSGSLVSRCFGGKCPSPSLGRQMFDLNKIHTMVSWWDASFWIHPDFICCSFVSGGQSLLCSSQCTMELRCIDW